MRMHGAGLKSASMRILSLGVFSAKKLHLKHGNTAIHGGKKVDFFENPVSAPRNRSGVAGAGRQKKLEESATEPPARLNSNLSVSKKDRGLSGQSFIRASCVAFFRWSLSAGNPA